MNEDHAHVLLDALSELSDSIIRGAQPWRDYVGFEGDPKADGASYRQLIHDAQEYLERRLEKGDFQ